METRWRAAVLLEQTAWTCVAAALGLAAAWLELGFFVGLGVTVIGAGLVGLRQGRRHGLSVASYLATALAICGWWSALFGYRALIMRFTGATPISAVTTSTLIADTAGLSPVPALVREGKVPAGKLTRSIYVAPVIAADATIERAEVVAWAVCSPGAATDCVRALASTPARVLASEADRGYVAQSLSRELTEEYALRVKAGAPYVGWLDAEEAIRGDLQRLAFGLLALWVTGLILTRPPRDPWHAAAQDPAH